MSTRREDSKPNPAAGFTAAICGACSDGEHDLELLREAVRRSTHGMLMRIDCPLGTMYCHGRKASASAGPVILVQPCTISRSPLGSAVIVGPVRTADDLAAVASWLGTTPIDGSGLPPRLRMIQHSRQQSIRN
ncbi:hypothetical protein SAMN05216188_110162 [Lentzea xinjiangensis]|uniref:Uncharacterized protein n=1 Tax=Lentzea xinjiangensis TaxID=402600 RepID=A0A1H9NEX5_9PSEU|nr:hypothetical protein SAMN05216188_110162 [Lentzea xinjiangensis]